MGGSDRDADRGTASERVTLFFSSLCKSISHHGEKGVNEDKTMAATPDKDVPYVPDHDSETEDHDHPDLNGWENGSGEYVIMDVKDGQWYECDVWVPVER